MSIDREGKLPCGITVSVAAPAWKEGRWFVEYVGTPAELRAAGVVDEVMEPKILGQRSGVMLSATGIEFRVRDEQRMASAAKRVLWERGEAVTLQFRPSRHAMMNLPGVRELYPDGVPQLDDIVSPAVSDLIDAMEGKDDRTVSWLDRCAAMARQTYGGSIVKRTRAVGRYQRLVDWASVGQLIIPDFVKIKAHVIVGRGGSN